MTTLDRAAAKAFYDRFGSKQDAQHFYEDAAVGDLIAHSAFDRASSVFEFGCGTGRIAELVLERLPHDARYEAVDVSSTMVVLASRRLERFGARVRVRQIDGDDPFAGFAGRADRILTTYVLDLLPEDEIARFFSRAAEVIASGGLLSIAGLTFGEGLISRSASAGWRALFRIAPRIVGGCRPLRMSRLVAPPWEIEHRSVIASYGIASEVLVARRHSG